jgi:hypothetical protein
MEESTFKFRISLGYAGTIDLWVEIPVELYKKVCESVGNSKMERLEFGFKFADIVKEKFPELDTMIHQEIDKWKSEHYDVDIPDHILHMYGLTSPWFE